MRNLLKFFWLLALVFLVVQGSYTIWKEWEIRSIHAQGEIVEVKIEELRCTKGLMAFYFEKTRREKKIDARTCIVFNIGQKIKLKHSRHYPDTFLFVNERNPMLFLLGGLEMALGVFGLVANWPMNKRKRTTKKLAESFAQSLN